jgi:4-alpha-glucanotransferase
MVSSTTADDPATAESSRERRSGVLLHLTSLPGAGACGDLGEHAYYFVDFLKSCGFSVWQMLPVGPTLVERSPYQTSSVHAGNPRLIALKPLLERGFILGLPDYTIEEPDAAKAQALRHAWAGFQIGATEAEQEALKSFVTENGYWLEDYALFRALREEQERQWWMWPVKLRDRDPKALAEASERLEGELAYIRFEQHLFFSQWHRLRAYANTRGVRLFGDLPIFVAHDSAEVWAHPMDFDLDPEGGMRNVAGVPPDYFSATGQRWGNPLYDWKRMAENGFQFWIDRMRTQLRLFDLVRIDHFRGFEAYWEIPGDEPLATKGRWVKAPGEALFARLQGHFGPLPLVAEDLGVITPEVDALRKRLGLPGMKVLQFAFTGEEKNPYLPFRHDRDAVVYTGTHDNNTTLGWFESLDDGAKGYVYELLGNSYEAMPWPMIRAALASRADLAIIPMQDVLALGSAHRMNVPGVADGNWAWRFGWEMIPAETPGRIYRMNQIYLRLPTD